MTNWVETVQVDGPLGWWRLNETTGTVAADSVGSNTGTYSGTPTLGVAGLLVGEVGNTAVLFNNSTVQRVAIPGAGLNPASVSVEAVIRATSFTGNNRIVQKGNTDNQWRLTREGGIFKWDVFGHGVVTFPLDAAKHHLVGTYDATTGLLAMYVDGSLVGTTPGAPGAAAVTSGDLNIGQKPNSVVAGDGFNGAIDEVAVYGYALSGLRIKAHADAALSLSVAGDRTWHLYLRDDQLQRQGEIDDYASLETVLRFNDVGTWTLELDRRQRHAGQLSQPGWGVILVRDATVVMSGPATFWQHSVGDSQRLAVTGVDDNIWLRRRVVSPVPSASSPPYSAQEYDVRTGVASTVLRQYVNVNLGPSAALVRRNPGVTLGVDPLAGNTVTGRGRWQRLLTLLQELALAGNIGFRLIQADTTLEFQVYALTDKTETVKFSLELGNLASYEYELTAPESTYAYVLGGGEGTARTVQERSDPSSTIWGRIEGEPRDRRDTTDATEMDQSGDEALTEQGQKTSLSITPVDTSGTAYGGTYNLGDRVTVQLDESQIQDLVRQVSIQLTPQGQRVRPGVGTDRADVLTIFRAWRAMAKRLSDLERRR